MTKRRMYKGKEYDIIPSTPSPVKRKKKWKPKPRGHKYHFGKKAKKEHKVLMCCQDKNKVCSLIQLRLAPPNLCSLTETRCLRLKRRRQTLRRRSMSKSIAPEKPKSVFRELFEKFRGVKV